MKILVASTAFPDAARLLRERLPDDEVIVDPEPGAEPFDIIVPLMGRIDAALMDRVTPRLVQQYGVGLEGVNRAAARARGIAVANVPAAGSGNADGVGETALLHLLALTRGYEQARQSIRERRLGEPVGAALFGSRVVVLGLGDVGQAVARRLSGFDVELVGVGTRTGAAAAAAAEQLHLAAYLPVSRLTEALATARALVVCCVLSDRTRGLVGTEALAALGADPPGYLVNVARGPVVDRDALLHALRSGGLAGAGLDVFWDEPVDPDDPLLSEAVTVTPHIGGVTDRAYVQMADRVVENVERLRRGEPVPEAR